MARSVERILVLGLTPLTAELVSAIDRRPDRRRMVVGVLDDVPPPPGHPLAPWFLGPLSALRAVVQEVRPHRIVVALTERRGRMPVRELLGYHIASGILIEDAAECYERLTGKLAIEALSPMGMMSLGRGRPSKFHSICSTVMGRSAAFVALVVASPLLALIAAAIKLGSPGPVLFVQTRVGAHGRPFRLMKFRTMHDRRTAGSEWECDNRDRVTRIGAWLRAFRLDELPQLVNVLRGEMNLVGPRPHPASNLELFTLVGRNLIELTGAPVSCYALRGLVRPGLTGWAQVRYQYANNLEEEIEKLRYDLYYVKHQSLRLDARILVETIRPLVFGRVVRPTTPSTTTAAPQSTDRRLDAAPPARPVRQAARRTTVGSALVLAMLLYGGSTAFAQGGQGGSQSSNGSSSTTTGAKPPSRPLDGAVKGADRDYYLGIDDVFEATVWNNKDLTRTVRVRPDGKVSLPLLQDIVVAGLTPMQLQTWLTEALAGYMKQPEVSVIVHEVHSRKVSVIGEVREPGRYEITGRTTVLDVLSMAGGLNDYADRNGIVLIRQDGASSARVAIDYSALMSGKNWNGGRANFVVLPGDIIVVR
jgi:lipopolysaccharide/colanic/teichoic acid biosynthesis glycosyltransferase/protein involved in polysaccharide export with SLBB domain